MEQIAGPVFGFFLACYTVQADEGYYAYAKVCIGEPASVWEPGPTMRKVAAGPFRTEQEAMHAVISRAERKLARREARQQDWVVLDSTPQPLRHRSLFPTPSPTPSAPGPGSH